MGSLAIDVVDAVQQEEAELAREEAEGDPHYSVRGCHCLLDWTWQGQAQTGCSTVDTAFSEGKPWCQVTTDCKKMEGALSSGEPWDYCFMNDDLPPYKTDNGCHCSPVFWHNGLRYEACGATSPIPGPISNSSAAPRWCKLYENDATCLGALSTDQDNGQHWDFCTGVEDTSPYLTRHGFHCLPEFTIAEKTYKGCSLVEGMEKPGCVVLEGERVCKDCPQVDAAGLYDDCWVPGEEEERALADLFEAGGSDCHCLREWDYQDIGYHGCRAHPEKQRPWCFVAEDERKCLAADGALDGRRWRFCDPFLGISKSSSDVTTPEPSTASVDATAPREGNASGEADSWGNWLFGNDDSNKSDSSGGNVSVRSEETVAAKTSTNDSSYISQEKASAKKDGTEKNGSNFSDVVGGSVGWGDNGNESKEKPVGKNTSAEPQDGWGSWGWDTDGASATPNASKANGTDEVDARGASWGWSDNGTDAQRAANGTNNSVDTQDGWGMWGWPSDSSNTSKNGSDNGTDAKMNTIGTNSNVDSLVTGVDSLVAGPIVQELTGSEATYAGEDDDDDDDDDGEFESEIPDSQWTKINFTSRSTQAPQAPAASDHSELPLPLLETTAPPAPLLETTAPLAPIDQKPKSLAAAASVSVSAATLSLFAYTV